MTPGYPFYGMIGTEPAGQWARLQQGPYAIVDRALLIALNANVGDSLAIGYVKFEIIGAIKSMAGQSDASLVMAPRVFLPERYTSETQLLGFGSRASYEWLVKLPPSVSSTAWVEAVPRRDSRTSMCACDGGAARNEYLGIGPAARGLSRNRRARSRCCSAASASRAA